MPSLKADFPRLLREEVMEHFGRHQRSVKGNFWLHIKPIIFVTLLGLCYFGFIFHSSNTGVAFLWCLGMIFAMGGIGFGFAHDSCHGAFSHSRFWNQLTGCGYDLMGASSYVWRWKHNILHHGSPNHIEHDPDVQTRPFLRLAKDQPWFPMNRYQHFYFLFLYFFILIRWHLWQDFATYFKGELMGKKFLKPKGINFLIFWGGKIISIFFALIFPSFYLPFYKVLGGYLVVMGGLGIFLGTLIQVAHCTDGASFETLGPDEVPMSLEDQIRRSSNFCPRNWFLTWYTGGLNFQIEHHLFPGIASIHYPELSVIVKATCNKFEIPYLSYDSLFTAFKGHISHLKKMGELERN